MGLTVTVVPGGDSSWDSWLQGAPHDVYHLRGYHIFASELGEGDPYLVVAGDRDRGLAWPYLLRPIVGVEANDVTSVYGYPGPVAWGLDPGDRFLSLAWEQFLATWRDQNVVSVFTRFHPLVENAQLATAFYELAGEAGEVSLGLVAAGETVSVDCTLDDDAALAGYTKVLRQEIASARRAGLLTTEIEDWTSLEDFIRLYQATMDRSGAARRYYMDGPSVLRLRDLLDGHLHLLITRLGDDVAAAGLFTEHEGIVQAFLVGTEERLRAHSPLKVLLDDARRWARTRGSTVLHLGGGRAGHQDSLLAFKRRFSPRRHKFHTGGWVLQAGLYRHLAESRAAERSPLTNDFFPAYRRGEQQVSEPD